MRQRKSREPGEFAAFEVSRDFVRRCADGAEFAIEPGAIGVSEQVCTLLRMFHNPVTHYPVAALPFVPHPQQHRVSGVHEIGYAGSV